MNAAVLSILPEVGRVEPVLRNTDVALGDLTDDQLTSLRLHMSEIRHAQRRIGFEITFMAGHFTRLFKLLGPKRFDELVQSELDMSPRTARRYLHINEMIETHFRNPQGLVEVERVSKLSQRAFNLLTSTMDDEVIAEIKEIADKGGKVDEATVRKILSAREQEYGARIASAEAVAEQADRALTQAKMQSELETGRLKGQMSVNEELLRRVTEQRDSAQHELDEVREQAEMLRQQATIVEEKIVEKEVVPGGFASIEEAVAAEHKKLTEAQNRRAQAEQAVAQLEQERQRLLELQAGSEELQKLREQVEAVILKYPVARMKAISMADQSGKALVECLGSVMVDLGNQLLAGSK